MPSRSPALSISPSFYFPLPRRHAFVSPFSSDGIAADAGGVVDPGADGEGGNLVAALDAASVAVAAMEGPARPEGAGEGPPRGVRAAAAAAQRPMSRRQGRLRRRPPRNPLLHGPLRVRL